MTIKTIFTCALFSLALAACSHGGHHKGHHDGHHAMKDHHKMMWQKMDTNSDGTVTKAEFDKMHADKFKEMDANGDGKITTEEHKAMKMKMMKGKKDCCGGKGDKAAKKHDCKSGEC